jgi:cysteinyl-tRNA synthetase
VQFVKYWIHNNMVTVDGQKMSRSLNNFINLRQAFSGTHERLIRHYEPLAIRQLVLNSHYRSPLDFSDAALYGAQSGYKRITETVETLRKKMTQARKGELDPEIAEQLKQLREKFEAAMNDDLNTSIALSVIFELVRLANKLLEDGKITMQTLNAVEVLFGRLGGEVLGIVKDEYIRTDQADNELVGKLVGIVIEQRSEARNEKNFVKADNLRRRLDNIGIVLEDKPDGTEWRWK